MILFTSPKPFTDETAPVQLSAIRSWKTALPTAQIIIFGNEPGLEDLCMNESVEYGGAVEVDHQGIKNIGSVFRAATSLRQEEDLIFVNSDILLDSSALTAWEILISIRGPFLGTARRRCLPPWVGPALGERELAQFLESHKHLARWGPASALDIFYFRGFRFETMPSFRIGQAAWDNWMIFEARRRGIPAIDLSRTLRPFHFDHNYRYSKGNPDPGRRHQERDNQNLDLLGGEAKRFHMGHCDWEAAGGKLRKRRGLAFWQREMEFLRLRDSRHHWWLSVARALFRPLIRFWEQQTTRAEDWNLRFPAL